jgi:epoxyqueuosine reductase
MTELSAERLTSLSAEIKRMGVGLGFQKLAIADIDLEDDRARLEQWLALGRHGEMEYMRRHGSLRSRPDELVPNTIRVISARMDYWPADARGAEEALRDNRAGYVARYALGRDYHKVLRARLKRLAGEIESVVGEFGYRVFVDSAPVLEKALARNAGIGWIGKHTNVIDRRAGSWFFLGEIFTDLPLPPDRRVGEHCGSCTACLDICPTSAIVAPYELDARRCISYLTIEYKGVIPNELRPLIGNRIFGCDDCQLVCPWNRYARATAEPDFKPRHGLDSPQLVELLGWSETTWRRRTEGSALRRPGYLAWLRNVAVALGNASTRADVLAALRSRASHPSELVREHVKWALDRHENFAQ